MSRTKRYGLWIVALGLPVAIVAVMSSLVVGQQGAAGGALDTMSQDANQWVMPLGNYAGMRHSKLNQITAQNVGRLQVAWTMSLGTLRGQEGQPLVIGNMMYLVSSYPNYVYAIDLNSYWRIAWKFAPDQDKFAPSVACCDVVNRGVAYARRKDLRHHAGCAPLRARCENRQGAVEREERRSQARSDDDVRPAGHQRQGHRRHLRRRVRRPRLPHVVRPQYRQAGVARPQRRARPGNPVRSREDHRWRHPAAGGHGFQPEKLDERGVEAWRRHDVGMAVLRSRSSTFFTTGPAILARGIRTSARATTSGR